MSASASLNCYHCGLPVPGGVRLSAAIDGEARPMCCIGCQAVAEAIVAGGLADYYRHREALPVAGASAAYEAVPALVDALGFYDHADFQKDFVRALDDDECEASLIIEGITCAACIWLNERQLARQDGVTAAHINFATHRALVRWDSRRIRLSQILAAIAAIGYRAHPYDVAKSEALAREEKRVALRRIFVAGFGMMQVMMYAVPAYLARSGEMTDDIAGLLRWASMMLTLPVVVYSSAPFFRGAWRDLKLRRVGMDVPVALGIGAAFVASVAATLAGSGAVYFDSIAMFVFFLLAGRFLEMRARQSAVGLTEALARLRPATALRLAAYPRDRAQHEVLATDLVVGDVVLVRPGALVPADGRVLEGTSSTNEALLSGESAPLAKAPGSPVTGGAINIESPLIVEVGAVGEATRLAAIIRLMERAAEGRPRVIELADRIAARFVAVVLVLAAAVALFWLAVDPALALPVTVSVLIVTCPCALALATPIALTVASGAMAKAGLLVTRSHAIETLARATHVVFDKTGTLTTGCMRLTEVLPLAPIEPAAALALAAALEQGSEHAIGAALRAAAPIAASATSLAIEAIVNEPGQGISARALGSALRIGRPDYVAALHGRPLPDSARALIESGDTVIALGDAREWLALFRFADEARPHAAAMVEALRKDGRELVLLTGDAAPVANRLAAQLGIATVAAALSPQGKYDYVQKLQAQGAIVAMVGDGVNDAPVLAAAQVSVAMGGGSQLARAQADLVLLSDRLDHLGQGFVLARRTLAVIRQNLAWAFLYNLAALPLAMAGWVSPWQAGIGMSGSSLLVVLNSLRLQRDGKK